jgi:hypothetical protein
MENLFETLAEITRPINWDNPFGIDYSPYVDCEILNVFSNSVKVRVVGNDDVAHISKNYVLYKTMEVGEVVRANKNFLNHIKTK